MTWRIANLVSLLLLVILTGCASISSAPKFRVTSPFKKLSRTDSHESKEETLPQEPEREEPTKRQPLIARKSKDLSRPKHSASTQQYIESELRDASPEERAEWNAYLATVDSAKVFDALNNRRASQSTNTPTSPSDARLSNQTVETHSDIKRVGHSVTSDSAEKTEPALAKSVTHQEIDRQQAVDRERSKEKPQEPNSRNWSGQLKSLTEWEKNPLNFSKDEQPESSHSKRERRSKPLPQIISNPFRSHPVTEPEAETSQTKARTILFEKDEETKPATPSDSLRIAPGAKLWEEELHKLVSLMEAEASAYGSNGSGELSRDELRQQVALRMLYLMNNQAQLAMQPIPGLQPADQEFWTSIFWGLSNYLNEEGIDPSERSTKTIEKLRSATHYLQIAAKLQLRNVTFCSRINGFGNFERLDASQLTAGQPVLIYCDVRNFQSESSNQNDFITKLRSSIEIYQGGLNGQLVDRNSFPATEDRCQTIRTDYYNSYRIDLPPHLIPGRHVLKLTVYDEFSGKSATELIHFTIQ